MVKVSDNEKLTWNDIKEQIAAAWEASGMKDFSQRLKRIRILSKNVDERRKDFYKSVISVMTAQIEFLKTIGDHEEIKKTQAEIRQIEREMNEPEFISDLKFILEKCKNAFTRQQ
ncbi:hypothetical protein KA062_03065 [Patescibacteria group bacterium]|nr:hypothetical protein [Patescibacteria group bacterium]